MIKTLCIAVLTLVVIAPFAANATLLPAAQALFVSDKAGSHPKKMTLKIPIAVGLPGSVAACVEYGHTLGDDSRGTITVKLSVVRDGSTVLRRTLKGTVKDSHYDGCRSLGSVLRVDDEVRVKMTFRKFDRLSKGDGFVAIAGLIPE